MMIGILKRKAKEMLDVISLCRDVAELAREVSELKAKVTFLAEEYSCHGHLVHDGDGIELLACTDSPTNLVDFLSELEEEACAQNHITKH
jgi:hypothetical protein